MSLPSGWFLVVVCCIGGLTLAAGGVVASDAGGVVVNDVSSPDADEEKPLEIIDVTNSSNYLSPSPENVTQESYESVGIDVAGAVETDALRLQGENERRALEHGLSESDGEGSLERNTAQRLEVASATLEQERYQLFQDYSNGTVDTSTLFRELVRLDVTAEQYRQLADTAREEGDVSGALGVRYTNAEGTPALLPSRMKSYLESGLVSGDQSPVYVQGANESLVIATVSSDTYLREALLFDQYDPGAPEQFGTGERSEPADAFHRAELLYPWTIANTFEPDIRGFGNSSVYRLTAEHSHGSLLSYLDGATTNPFYEIHEKNSLLVPTESYQEIGNGMRLDVDVTAPTGPMEIDVRQTLDGEAEEIHIYVDDNYLGTLDGSGELWTVQPRGVFEVTAETDDGDSVSVTIVP